MVSQFLNMPSYGVFRKSGTRDTSFASDSSKISKQTFMKQILFLLFS
jgi:hypothetical protein